MLYKEIKTSELKGTVLDWAVAKCEGRGIEFDDPRDPWLTRDGIADQPLHSYTPSTDWAQGGPIIEREGISIGAHLDGEEWFARDYWGMNEQAAEKPLIAAMRCYVVSKMGDFVSIPVELLEVN